MHLISCFQTKHGRNFHVIHITETFLGNHEYINLVTPFFFPFYAVNAILSAYHSFSRCPHTHLNVSIHVGHNFLVIIEYNFIYVLFMKKCLE